MPKDIKIHTPKPTTHLPAHEQKARRDRAAALHLPGIPGHAPRRSPKPLPRQPGRKTHDLRDYNAPNLG